jgi:hypothetical protein
MMDNNSYNLPPGQANDFGDVHIQVFDPLQPGDEGWWIDDIRVTGALQDIAQPPPDTKPPGPATCPPAFCDDTQPPDHGFDVDLVVLDADGDGFIYGGEPVTLSAAATSNPGGCVGGGAQFRFFKGGVALANVVQDWSSDPTYNDNPTADAEYHVQVRCSVFPACISTPAAAAGTESILVYPGDGQDIVLSLTHTAGTTTVSWPSRIQSPLVSGYDLYKGTINSAGDPGLATLAGLTCLSGNIAQPPGAPGPLASGTEAINPALGKVTYFLAGHSPLKAGGQAALGRRFDGVQYLLRALPPVCP